MIWHVYPGDTLPVLVGAVALCGHVAEVETDRLIGPDDERCSVCVALLTESEAPQSPTKHSRSERGFAFYEPISTGYGHVVRVYESSSAEAPHLWLSVELTEESARAARSGLPACKAHAHLSLDQARAIRDALNTAIDNHYQCRL